MAAAGGRRAAGPRAVAAAGAAAPLPRVYAYDHCPYCVRVRLGMGLKGIKHEPAFLQELETCIPCSCPSTEVDLTQNRSKALSNWHAVSIGQ